MIEKQVSLKNAPFTARKARLLRQLIINQDAVAAARQLETLGTENAKIVAKLIHSGIAAIKIANKDAKDEDVIITKYFVNEGMKLKRQLLRSRARASQFQKQRSHIIIGLKVKENK